MNIRFIIFVTFAYHYASSYSKFDRFVAQSHELVETRKSDIISGYDMRVLQEKYIDLSKYEENFHNVKIVQELLKKEILYQDRFFLGGYDKNVFKMTNLASGGLFNDFDDCFFH
jgi:hypothetical protein